MNKSEPNKLSPESGGAGCVPVSVIVPTRNEEANLGACLDSVQWAEAVYVVDSHSTDATAEIARAKGATLVNFEYDGGWPKKKNWAIRNLPITTAWVMIVDADEQVSEPLAVEIAETIRDTDVCGFYVRWKFVFLGRWMRHCWRHGWMLRLFRYGTAEYEDLGMRGEGGWDNEVHENLVSNGPTARLKEWLRHESNEPLSRWLEKQNQFSDWNAKRRIRQRWEPFPPLKSLLSNDPLVRRRFLKRVYFQLPAKPVAMFIYLYFLRLGILDGRAGLYFCALRAAHELNVQAKIFEASLADTARRNI